MTVITAEEILKELESMGTAQNVKVYQRHGMGDNLYGVSFANLHKLQKRIKTDQKLAQELWASGNADVRHLATMIADPETISEAVIDSWAKDLDYYEICDFLAEVVSKTEFAEEKVAEWTKSEDEWIARAGWSVLAQLALSREDLDDAYFGRYLKIIEDRIHGSKNFTKHGMNNALISLGIRSEPLKGQAQKAAKKIGKVEVDHGQTDCKTPDAFSCIERSFARKKGRLATRKTR